MYKKAFMDYHLKKKSIEQIIRGLKRYGPDKVKRFQSWVEMFE